ncbi:MAG: catabolite regulation protein CreA [Pseudohongiellaceae bacterium]|jgi:catabolite regulation protein CreA
MRLNNNQIKKEGIAADPIIKGVMCFVALASGRS